MLVTMATPISSHVKDKNSTFTAHDEDMIFLSKGNPYILYVYDNNWYVVVVVVVLIIIIIIIIIMNYNYYGLNPGLIDYF